MTNNSELFIVLMLLVQTIALGGVLIFKIQITHFIRVLFAWSFLAGCIFLTAISYNAFSLYLLIYFIYFFVIGLTVFISMIFSFIYKEDKLFAFSFAYLIPGMFSLIFLHLPLKKSLANAALEPLISGVLTSIIYLLDYKYNFARRRVLAILLCILCAFLITILTPLLPE